MKKTTSLLLALMFIFSGICSVYAEKTAGDTLSDEAVKNYVIEKGIWKNGEFEEDRAVTRGEFAGMIGRAIGVAETGTNSGFSDVDEKDINFKEISALSSMNIINGSDGFFRPNDTITREETAVIVEKIYKSIFEEFKNDTEYRETRFIDFNDISAWAVQSIVNVCDAGIVLARPGRTFAPKEVLTVLEAAKIAKYITNEERSEYVFSVSDAIDSPEEKYEVYQKSVITPQGVAGFGMAARFAGAPGSIYVARTTVKPESEHLWGNPAPPVVFARITDPSGNVVARVDLDYIENGKMEKVVNIPDGEAGIWQIQIINGRMNDVMEIGINGAVSWGIRGEPSVGFTETTPNELWFWVPKKFKQANFGSNLNFSVRDSEDAVVASTTDASRGFVKFDMTTAALKPETAYKVVFSENARPTFAMLGVPKLLSPTKEMAEDLQGNYVYGEDGMQFHGPLQKRARDAALEIYNKRGGDFSYTYEKPDKLPDEIYNPIGEANIMSAGGVAAVNATLEDQCLDPASPYFGGKVGRNIVQGKASYPENSWEVDYYPAYTNGQLFTSAISSNAQLNYLYGNQALIDRATIYLLYAIYSTNDMMTIDDTNPSARVGHNYYFTHGNFYLEYMTAYYYALKNYISPEYSAIIKEGLEIMTDKMMNFRGGGVSNQYTHSVISAMYMYLATGEERYHTYFKRGVRVAYGQTKGWDTYIGTAPAGYAIENYGCDASYYQMNVNFMGHFHELYCSSPMADPETVDIINNAINNAMNFESMFHGHKIDGLNVGSPRHFTSRTDSDITNRGGHAGYSKLIDSFPIARRMWERDQGGNWTTVFPHFLNNDKDAMKQIEDLWDKYDHYFDGSIRTASDIAFYDIFDGREVVDSEPIPVEQEDGIHDKIPGLISVKHKGLYFLSFYNSSLRNGTVAQKSYYGGGPSLLTSENTSGVVQSRRHTDATNADGVFSSCIYGNNSDGSFFVSGKEIAELEWLEEGKKFVISGIGVGNAKKISWTYELTDDGIIMTPSTGALRAGEEYWVNLPITEQTNESFKYAYEPGRLTLEFNDTQTVLEWDEALESKFLPAYDGMKRLRIKLPSSGEVGIKITTSK